MPRIMGAISSYGTGRTLVPPVYGGGMIRMGSVSVKGTGGKPGCTGCEPEIPYINALIKFVRILIEFKDAIDNFYPNANIGSSISGKIAARGVMDPRLFARVEWIRRYKDIYGKFDATKELYVNQLKDVFLSLGHDWRIDKFLLNWKPT